MPGHRGPVVVSARAGVFFRFNRRAYEVSQAELGEQMRALGFRWQTVTVGTMERGRRALTIDEFLALWRLLRRAGDDLAAVLGACSE